MSDYERKKSWKEIDQMRDGSRQRDRSQKSGAKITSTKRYKDSLDRLFDSGKICKLVDKMENMGKTAPAKATKKGAKKSTGKKKPIGGFIRKVKEAFATADERSRVDNAFRQYIVALKKAWSSVDPEAMTPAEMAAIANGMMWVTGVVGVVHRAGESEP